MPTVPGMMAEVAANRVPADTDAATTALAPAEANAAGPASADAAPAQDSGVPAMAVAAAQGTADVPLPDVVAYVPTPNPESPFAAAMPGLDNGAAATAETLPLVALIPEPNPVASGQIPVPVDIQAPSKDTPSQATAYAGPGPAPAPHKPRGFFALLFAPSSDHDIVTKASAHEQPRIVASIDRNDAKPLIDTHAPVKPVVDIDSDEEAPAMAHYSAGSPLPGVRNGNSLFDITRKSGGGDNSDVDINEEGAAPVEVASAAGMARLDPHGLLLQRETVDTACLRPPLLAVLKRIEQHYGRKLVVTSGYRSRVHNAAARGARNSLHMYCAAADVQMPGVSKWELAAYARSMQGRGGVGTYCYTKSVHIDIGPERDWNWRCRRKRHRHG
ncbi:MAG: D-Ala-D-Ala carboxypeptidase family metallohydrolase [Hyphomicrobiales bacterium]|nr:D-Ala-D-Ala carboxypeptidase family metallohydrolase [Hyphomicrobiales bacterium]